MFRLVTNNFWPKVLCLFLAAGAWFYVAAGESRIANFPGTVALGFRNVPGGMVAISDTDSVQLKISADRSVWQKLSPDNFSIYADLIGLSAGTYDLPVKTSSNLSGVQIIEVNPGKILVRLEAVATKTVPINTKIEGAAGEGLVAGDIRLDPEKIEISGAKSVLDRISEATVIIKLNGETSEFNKSVVPVVLDAEGETTKGLTFSPSEIKITVPIVKAGASKVVGIKVRTSGQPKSGYWISQITTDPLNTTIAGSSGILRSISYLETEEINIDGLSSDKIYQSALNLPSGVTLVDQLDRVKITVGLSEVASQREITGGLNWVNLASNLQVSSYSPTAIKILAVGPIRLLETLSAANVIINVNLALYKSGGTYNVDINRDSLTMPEGVGASGVVPSNINITLSNK